MQIPQNTLRKSGVGLMAVVGPLLTVGLKMLGVGECTPEMVEMGCVGGPEIAGALVMALGGGVYWVGQNRAHKAANTPAPPTQPE